MTSTLYRASESSTEMLWVDGFIKPVTIVHQYLQAEREGDWLLHQYYLRDMSQYFQIVQKATQSNIHSLRDILPYFFIPGIMPGIY